MNAADSQSRTIVITGAARGIGLATTRILAGRGHRIVMSDIDGDLAAREAEAIGPAVSGFALDVVDRDAFRDHLEMVESEIGPVDILVNNAGIASPAPRIVQQDSAITDRTIDINLKGTMNGTIEALRLMEPRQSGHIVNVASLAGLIGVRGLAAYSASKFGVVGFTESVRIEFAGSGIRFTCVMPGPVDTGMMSGTSSSPLIRMLSPEEMAEGIAGAIESGKPRVALPRSSWFLSRLVSILPPAVAIRIGHWTRIDRVYAEVDSEARAAYEQRIQR